MSEFKLIHISFTDSFLYKGVTFDWHNYCGPTILNRHNGEARKFENISNRNWSAVNKFSGMSKEDREQYRIN